MVKFLILLILFFFILNNINKKLLLIFYQNMLFLMILFMIFVFPLNNFGWGSLYYNLGMDSYSWSLIMLSVWILALVSLTSVNFIKTKLFNLYMLLLNLLLIFLILCFSTFNMILFYMFFESSLIPVFLLILGWGGQIERIQAGIYMMIYTLFGSFPLFIMILNLYILENSMNMNIINLSGVNLYIYLSLILAFLIKMPMYIVHLWLPKAHVEAPVIGSMILAGVMLKLGSYGLLRVMLIMMKMSISFNKFFMIFSLMGGIMSGLICLCQVDMKMLVAYSSIVHMSILMSGLMTLFNWGYLGGILMMIAHGLCSSGLFYLVNLNYERVLSRSLFINKGLINLFPSLSLFWFLLSASNLSFPPSLNLFGEIILFNSLLMWSKMLMLILMLISFFSACYTLYLYSFSQHGKFISGGNFFNMINVMSYFMLILHWIPLNLLFFFCLMLIN